MPLTNKFLRYSPEITLEIFTLVWDKLIESGFKNKWDNELHNEFKCFKDKHNYLIVDDTYFNTSMSSCITNESETTVQEILGYDPFVRDDFEQQNKPKQPLKQAVHCTTQEEWDFVTEKLGYKWDIYPGVDNSWNRYGDKTFINLSETHFNSIDNKNYNYQILSFQEWCDLNGYKMEKEIKFEVGKWYSIKTAYDWIIKFKEIKDGNIKAYWSCISKFGTKVEEGGRWEVKPTEIKELSIEEIQQYLPDNHPDKIKSNPGFKVGDWVKWHDGHIDTIKKHCDRFKDSWYLNKIYASCSEKVLKHATPEEINNHLISIGQIPIGEPLNTGIEPNKDGMFNYTMINGSSFSSKCSTTITRTTEIVKSAIEFNYLPEPE